MNMPTDTFATPLFSPCLLRPQQDQDRAAIAELYRQNRQDLLALPMPPEMITQLILQQQQFQHTGVAQHYPQAKTLVLVQQDQVVARMIFSQDAQMIHLIDIMVLPEFQGQGWGRKLLQHLQQIATTRQCGLSLRVMKDNAKAGALYTACGFRVVGENYLEQQMQWLPPTQIPQTPSPPPAQISP